ARQASQARARQRSARSRPPQRASVGRAKPPQALVDPPGVPVVERSVPRVSRCGRRAGATWQRDGPHRPQAELTWASALRRHRQQGEPTSVANRADVSSKSSPQLFYQSIADEFEGLDHPYDVARRLEVVFDELLEGASPRGRDVLDAGCGYGAFARRASARRANVVACDIAEKLVRRARASVSRHGVV